MGAPGEKRRLPVLGSSGTEDVESERPAWHWSAIGAVAVFLVWLPLAAGATFLTSHIFLEAQARYGDEAAARSSVRAAFFALHAGSFAIACLVGGLLVGRFGGKAGRTEAAVSGLAAGALAWGLGISRAGVGWAPALVLLIVLGSLGAFAGRVGGGLGQHWRPS